MLRVEEDGMNPFRLEFLEDKPSSICLAGTGLTYDGGMAATDVVEQSLSDHATRSYATNKRLAPKEEEEKCPCKEYSRDLYWTIFSY